MQFDDVRDSGVREEFCTGSVRDTREGKGRFDLIPPGPLKRLAQHYANGAKKYGDRNWEKGQPLGRYLDSAERHLNELKALSHDEDHAAAVAWNAFAFIFTVEKMLSGELPEELDDIGFLKGLREPTEPKPIEQIIKEAFAERFQETMDQYFDQQGWYTGTPQVRFDAGTGVGPS